MLSNWGEMLDNIFRPLFAVSCDPDSDPLLDSFLQHVSGIDSVDDESKLGLDQPETLPADWTRHENPSYRMCKAPSRPLLIAGALLLAGRICFFRSLAGRLSGQLPHKSTSSSDPDANACPDTYYIWANVRALNRLRASLGQNTFAFRPHCGEAGAIANLDATFLLADSINHGINLKRSPALQYLYCAQPSLAPLPRF